MVQILIPTKEEEEDADDAPVDDYEAGGVCDCGSDTCPDYRRGRRD